MHSTETNRATYAYCSNPDCPAFMQGSPSGLSEPRPYAVTIMDANSNKSGCPHCGTQLRCTCPNCGRLFHDEPLRFCPACGQSLLEVKRENLCEICGRPFCRPMMAQETVMVCSETCLSKFIERHVKTCDQCGQRFRVDPGNHDKLIGLTSPHDSSAQLDFCSEKCLEAYTEKQVTERARLKIV